MTSESHPLISVIVACYNSADTLQRTLNSLSTRENLFKFEVVITDDGSNPPINLEQFTWNCPVGTLILESLPQNQGKPYACNAGFKISKGIYCIILDSDDEFIPEWQSVIKRALTKWPADSPICFLHAVTETGKSTGNSSGIFTREQWLNGEGNGEFAPIFKGEVARSLGYQTGCFRKICGTLSYSTMLERGPLYIHPEVIRIYHTEVEGSITKSPFTPKKSKDSYECFKATRIAVIGFDSKTFGKTMPYHSSLIFKESIYMAFGVSRIKAVLYAFSNLAVLGISRTLIVTAVSLTPRGLFEFCVQTAKNLNLLRRFG